MKNFIRKWYRLIGAVFACFINTAGLVLSIIEISSGNNSNNRIMIYVILGVSEAFLIFSVIYSLVSIFKNKSEQIKLEEKNNQIDRLQSADKIIYENQKSIITTYKDCSDILNQKVANYLKDQKRINTTYEKLKEKSIETNEYIITMEKETRKEALEYLDNERINEFNKFRYSLIDSYNRFLGSITNIIRRSLEELISTKRCKKGVSITIKQMETPWDYNTLNDHQAKVYTAFRDYRTYSSKIRNETWEKAFTISKNSDFVISIEKDYYIFNFIDKKELDTGLYQNENRSFYEHYNSGITCTIYSCINKKRILFGYLACDSIFDKKDRKKAGNDIFDWKAANLMMHTAHVIAMYLQILFDTWNRYCIYSEPDKYVNNDGVDCNIRLEELKNKKTAAKNDNNKIEEQTYNQEITETENLIKENSFCNVIIKAVEERRYNN